MNNLKTQFDQDPFNKLAGLAHRFGQRPGLTARN